MNRIGYGIGLGLVCFGCSGEGPEEALGTTQQALNGTQVPAVGKTTGYKRTDSKNAVLYANASQQLRELKSGATWSVSTLASSVAANLTPTAVAGHDGWNRVFYRSSANQLRHIAISSSGVVQPAVTLVSGSVIAQSAYVGVSSVTHVTYRHINNHLFDMSYNAASGTWSTVDVSTASGAPLVLASGDPVSFYNGRVPTNEMVFRGPSNHVYRHIQNPGDPWSPAHDVSQACTTPTATGRPYGFRGDFWTAVVYRGTDARIWLSLPDPAPSCVDLTTLCGGPVSTSDPIGYIRNDGKVAIVYRGSDNKVRQMTIDGGACTNQNLTSAASAANPNGDAPFAYVRTDNFNAVVFTTPDLHRWELSQAPGSGVWAKKDMTAEAGGTP